MEVSVVACAELVTIVSAPFLTTPFLAGSGFDLCGLLADASVGNEPGHQVRGLRFVGDGATQMVWCERAFVDLFHLTIIL